MRPERPVLPTAPVPARRVLGAAAVVAVAAALVAAGGWGQTAAVAAAGCVPGDVYVNVGSGSLALRQYATDGTLVSSVPLAHAYGDIAFSDTGSTLYGAEWDAPVLDTIDPATGDVTASVPITGPAAGAVNALSALPDGSLLAGVFGQSQLWTVDPATGTSSAFRAALPAGYTSSGDFVSLSDGDVLAAADGPGGQGYLVRIHPDDTTTVVGSVPESYGAAQSGGAVYLAGADGDLYRVDGIPTAASTAPLPTTVVTATGADLWGAASPQDAGLCAPTLGTATPTAGTVGSAYTWTVPGTGNPAPRFTVRSGRLPAGLTLDPATGAVHGTPTAAGSSTVEVDVTNAVGSVAHRYTITVAAAAVPTGTGSTAPAGTAPTASVVTPASAAAPTGQLAFTGADGAGLAWVGIGAAVVVATGVGLAVTTTRRRRASSAR